MSYALLAFVTGLFGSLHCIGMCGPLAFSVPSYHSALWAVSLDKLVYQLGRIISYVILGLLIGLIGKQIWMADLQQNISLLTGILILTAAVLRIFDVVLIKKLPFFNPINKLLITAYQHKANHLIIGILNGFLPCGFVYLAMAGAVNTPSVSDAAQYMFWFGLGTSPVMFLAALGFSMLKPLYQQLNKKLIPALMILLGIWFVLRGLSLDIPYLSPAPKAAVENCN